MWAINRTRNLSILYETRRVRSKQFHFNYYTLNGSSFISWLQNKSFKKIKEWLKLEAATNPLVVESDTNFKDKKSDNVATMNNSAFKWSSHRQAQAEWLIRITSFFMAVTLPVLINKLIVPYELSVLKGLIGYSTLPAILFLFSRQKHRISHISA